MMIKVIELIASGCQRVKYAMPRLSSINGYAYEYPMLRLAIKSYCLYASAKPAQLIILNVPKMIKNAPIKSFIIAIKSVELRMKWRIPVNVPMMIKIMMSGIKSFIEYFMGSSLLWDSSYTKYTSDFKVNSAMIKRIGVWR